ncbi:MAG TPA: phospholipase D-like domain-containing protein, partial [Pirellulales bacterium]|nr:phospholipase D-like domain-containing protein [Pirellulales bacterium]
MPKTARGLSWERTTERIREFVAGLKGETPRRAVICTYDFDAERFEATVLPALTRRGRQFRTLVLSDAGALQEELAKVRGGRLGRYELAPVRCVGRGVFHPKLIYLAAGRRHLIGIGSSNLTQGGLGGNLELMLFTSDDGPNARSLADGATAFLSQLLLTTGIAIPQSARNFIENCVIGGVRNANSESVLHSLSNPLLYQMQMVHRTIAGVGPAKAVTVLSPWHSATASPDGTEPEMIARLAKSFNLRELSVYTNGTNRRGPSLGDAKVHIRDGRENGEATARTKNGTEDHALGDEQRMPTRVHAKAYLIEGDRATSFFFGSANCTKPALVQS